MGGLKGHSKFFCWMDGNGFNGECSICKTWGHKAADCPSKINNMDDGGGMCLGGGEKPINSAEEEKRDDEGTKSDEPMRSQEDQTQRDHCQWVPGNAYNAYI